jgi:Protein of unknown function (DUF2971)
MALFKYVTPDRVDILTNGEIRFSPPESFNDPFELKPHLPCFGTEEFYRRNFDSPFLKLIEQEYEALPAHLKAVVTKEGYAEFVKSKKPELFDETKAFAEEVFPNVVQFLKENFWDRMGILCLSERPDSLLMWAHYTDSHKGFVIEFNEQNPFFDQRAFPDDELRHLRKIRYASARPSIALAEIQSLDVFLTKSMEWEYEQEWRMLVRLEHAHRVIKTTLFPIHLFKLPLTAITSLYLGCRSEAQLETEVRHLIQSRDELSHVRLYKSSIDQESYKLNF